MFLSYRNADKFGEQAFSRMKQQLFLLTALSSSPSPPSPAIPGNSTANTTRTTPARPQGSPYPSDQPPVLGGGEPRRRVVVNGTLVEDSWGLCSSRPDEGDGEEAVSGLLGNATAPDPAESDDDKVRRWSSVSTIERAERAAREAAIANLTPKVLHFIWVSPFAGEQGGGTCAVPRFAVRTLSAWEAMHEGWVLALWTDKTVRMYFEEMTGILLRLLPKAAWVSDVIRFGVLERFGGLYIDVDTMPLKSWESVVRSYSPFAVCMFGGEELVVGRGRGGANRCKMVANGVIATPVGSPLMARIYRQVVLKSQKYGQNGKRQFDVKTAGPVVLTRELRRHDASGRGDNATLLSSRFFFPCQFRTRETCFVADVRRDKQLFAVHLWRGSWHGAGPS